MDTVTVDVRTVPTATVIADLAVAALHEEVDLTPKPGLVDRRGPGAHTDMDRAVLHASAASLRPAFEECARAADELSLGTALRARIGRIGRAGEREMLTATAGVNTHRGALWALGLLSAAAASTSGSPEALTTYAGALAQIPDPAADPRTRASRSHGALARYRYGVTGAAGEARAGFPHVRHHALPALEAARARGADEPSARLDALVALVAHVEDTCVLHRGGTDGLRAVQAAARSVLDAGGCHTAEGRRRLIGLDELCRRRHLSPGGSADLLAAALFIEAVEQRT